MSAFELNSKVPKWVERIFQGWFFFFNLYVLAGTGRKVRQLKYTAFSICILGLFVKSLHTKECKTKKERRGPESRVGRKRSACSEILGVYSFDSKKKKVGKERREEGKKGAKWREGKDIVKGQISQKTSLHAEEEEREGGREGERGEKREERTEERLWKNLNALYTKQRPWVIIQYYEREN